MLAFRAGCADRPARNLTQVLAAVTGMHAFIAQTNGLLSFSTGVGNHDLSTPLLYFASL